MTDKDFQNSPVLLGIWVKRITIAVVLLFFAAVAGLFFWFNQYRTQPGAGAPEDVANVVIPKGSSVQKINRILARADLTPIDIRFVLLARYLELATKLQAGEFMLHRGQLPEELLRELSTAKPVQHAVTIPEGLVIAEIADIFSAGGWCDREEFIRLANDPEFVQKTGVSVGASLEGYLYPDTYYLTRKAFTAEDILRMQVNYFFKVWKPLAKDLPPSLSFYDVLILASMVEKETGRASERPLIAGVFLNRLQKGMRMQSDPTVMYGIDNFSGKLSRKDLRTPSPYNTYTVKRLPAGPICNPGKDALTAVLHPEKSNYLYFVSKNNGRHEFSSNLRDHNRAVNKYQRSGNK